uniref:Reelin n=1 Tax=Magallana gigas TaxID=29159 RepID=K1PCE9_MAGGI
MADAMLRGELMELTNQLLTNKFNTKTPYILHTDVFFYRMVDQGPVEIRLGVEWKLLSRHDAEEYLLPKRAAYELPDNAKKDGVQFRCWQPVYQKTGYDQWAIDQVEVIQ